MEEEEYHDDPSPEEENENELPMDENEIPMDESEMPMDENERPEQSEIYDEQISEEEYEEQLPETPETEIEQQVPVDEQPPVEPEETQNIIKAYDQYAASRQKRNLLGSLFLGLGIILYAALWLVVVDQVFSNDSGNVFGITTILLLVAGGVLFILGLFLILTYPKSSLREFLA